MYRVIQSDNDESDDSFLSTSESERDETASTAENDTLTLAQQLSEATDAIALARRREDVLRNVSESFLFGSSEDTDDNESDEGEEEKRATSSSQSKKRKRKTSPATTSSSSSTQTQRITVAELNKRQRTVPPSANPAEMANGEIPPPEEEIEIVQRDEGWNVEKAPNEHPIRQEGHFKPMILPTRRRMEALLMPGEDPFGPCFACSYQENGTMGIIGQHWNTMAKMIHESILVRPPEEVFREVHRYFVSTVMTPFAKNCHDDDIREQFTQIPLECIWSPYKVAQHFTQHTIDPLLNTVFDVWDLKAVKEMIKCDGLALQHDASGRVIIDSKAIDVLVKIRREEDALYKRPITKMLGFNANSTLPERYAHVHEKRVAVVPFHQQRPYQTQYTIEN